MHAVVGWAALAMLVSSLLGSAWLEIRPKGSAGPVAALFPPWWQAKDAFGGAASAGALVVGVGGLPTMLIVMSPDLQMTARLYAAGVLLLLDPRALGGCLTRL